METNPWEQQPGEPDRDFRAFEWFLSGFCKQAIADQDGRSRARISHISKQWKWESRAERHRLDQPPPEPTAVDLLPPQDAATVLIDNVLSDAQVSHLQKISDYQARAERLGNAQISIAGQLLQIAQQRITAHRQRGAGRLPSDVERIIRSATLATTSGHKLVGDALGIEELFLTMQEHLQSDDPALKPVAPAEAGTI